MPMRVHRRRVVVPKRFVHYPSMSSIPAVQMLMLKAAGCLRASDMWCRNQAGTHGLVVSS